MLFSESKEYYQRYIVERTLTRIRDSQDYRSILFIPSVLIQQLLIPALLVIIVKFVFGKKYQVSHDYKKSILFLVLGLAGSLPIMLTPIQKSFYISPSMPFFAIGISIALLPCFIQFSNRTLIQLQLIKGLKIITILICLTVVLLTFLKFNKISSDAEILQDVAKIGKTIEPGTVISSSTNIYYNWIFHSYLIRNEEIYPDYKNKHDYLLIDKRIDPTPDKEFQKVDLELLNYELYLKK